MERLYMFVVACLLSTSCLAQPRKVMSKTAVSYCTLTDSLMQITLLVAQNDDDYCEMTAVNADRTTVECQSNLNNYNAVRHDYQVSATIDMNDPTASPEHSCGAFRYNDPSAPGQEAYRVRFQCWKNAQNLNVYGAQDVLYTVSCVRASATDTKVSVQTQILNENFEQTVTPTPFSVTLHVMRVININTGSVQEVSDAQFLPLGASYILEARLPLGTNTPTGIYLYTTRVSNNPFFRTQSQSQDVTHTILRPDGCPSGSFQQFPYIPQFEFERFDCDGTRCRYRTGVMTAVLLASTFKDTLYFDSYFQPCLTGGDQRCDNFCTFSTLGRRKRSEDDEGYLLTTSVRLTDGAAEQEGEDAEETVIIAAASSVAGVLAVIATVVLCVAIAMRRRHRDEDRSRKLSAGSKTYVIS